MAERPPTPRLAAPLRRAGLWLAGGLLLALAAAARLPFTEGEPLLAWGGGEVWGHLWTWWWHGQALPAWPAGTDLARGSSLWPVIDPLPTLLGGLLSRLSSPVLAWNLLAVGALVLAFCGGAWCARRCGGHPWTGGLVLAMGPIFTGGLVSGLSEDLALGLLAVVLTLALVPTPPGRQDALPSWPWALGLGLGLGSLAWCGLYLAWLGAGVALVAGLVRLRRQARALPRWICAAALAALLAAPPLLQHGERALTGAGHHSGTRIERVEPLWRVNPWRQADLASFLAPGRADLPEDAVVRLHPVYLGLAALLLALAGGRSRWWWLLAAALLLAPGPSLRWAGQSLGLRNPAAQLLEWLPGGSQINHHARLFLLGQVALAMLASRGARRLKRWAPAAAALVALEYALLAPLPWPLPSADAAAPDLLRELHVLPAGGLLWLPMGGPGISPQRALLDQRAHGRPLALDPNHPGPPSWAAQSATASWLFGLGQHVAPAAPGEPLPCELTERDLSCLAVAQPWSAEVERHLGPPDLQGADGAAWNLLRLCQVAVQDADDERAAPATDMLMQEQAP